METSFQATVPSPPLNISVIIPVHNGGPTFRRCLSCLVKSVPPPDEIIVVADGCTDGSEQVAQEFGVQILRLVERKGPAGARNRGAQVSQSDILFFMDADVTIPPDTFSQIESVFKKEPNWAAVFGSYDDKPEETNFLSQYKNLFHHYTHQSANEEAFTFWGACGAIRHDVFMSMGGFNESYRQPSIEDIEFGYRLKRAGYRIRLCKALQVKHLKRWEPISLLKSDFFHRALPWTELILKNRRFVNDLNLRLSSRISVILTFSLLASLMGGLWWPTFFGIAGALSLLLLTINKPLYLFFQKRRGLRFAIQSILWHWFYYLYSGLAFIIGIGHYLLGRLKSSNPGLSATSKVKPGTEGNSRLKQR